MANETLEKNQAESFDSMVAKYFFTATGGGVVEPVKSPEKKALKPGIRLHFLRYGLFDRNADGSDEQDVNGPSYTDESKQCHAIFIKDNSPEHFTVKQQSTDENTVTLNEVEVLSLEELPNLENFHVARTAVNPGYIYLINDEDPDDYYELRIDESGQLQHVLWEYNKDENGEYLDQREPSGEKSDYKLVEPGKKLWIAYSPVQWSRQYHHELNTSAEKREKRMKLIDCSGIRKGEEDNHENVVPFKDVKAVFPKDHPRAFALKGMLHQIHADEKKQDSSGDNEVFEDMFVSLHDPLGCALDVSEITSEKTLQLQATIQAIQSGETIQQAYGRLLKGNLDAPKPDEEYQQLFTLALTCYQMVYNEDDAILKYDGGSPGWFNFSDRHFHDPRPLHTTYYNSTSNSLSTRENTKHIGYGLDPAKLKGILGVEERNNARNKMLNYREDLGKMVSCSYIRKYLDDYLGNHPERVLEGRNVMLDIIDSLSYHPYKHDRHLMLRREYVEKDKWVHWVYEAIDDNPSENIKNKEVKSESENFKGLDPMLALLGAPLNIEAVLSKANPFSQQLAGVYKKHLKHRASQAADLKEIDGKLFRSIAEKQDFVVKKLNKNLKVYRQKMFEIVDGDIWMRLEELGVELDPEYVKRGKYTGKREDILRILKESHPEGFQYRTVKRKKGTHYNIKLKVREDKTSDVKATKNYKISKIVNGRAFNGVFALLEVYNFSNACIKVSSEGSTEKDVVYAMGSAIKLGDAVMGFIKTVVKAETANLKMFKVTSTSLSIIGGGVTAAWCFYDSFGAMDEGDMDAGFALMGAGVAFSVSAAASLGTIAILGGPVGWIAAAVGVGLLILGSLLTDTELETYFKNFLLCDREEVPKPANMSPMEYTLKILEKREDLTHKDFLDSLMNPLDAQAKLFDYIVCKQIAFNPINSKKERFTNPGFEPGMGHITTSLESATQFSAKMVFSRFFNHPDQVEAYAFFYPKGIKNKGEIAMQMGIPNKIYDSKNSEALEVKFWIPKAYESKITLQSDIVFAVRLKVDDSQSLHFPYPLGGKERFLGAKIKARTLSAGLYISTLKQNKEVTIAQLNELRTEKLW